MHKFHSRINFTKSLFAFIIFAVSSVSLHAQLCKKARVGMTSNELIKSVGMPDSTVFLGSDKVTMDTLSVWYYGKQQAVVTGGKVDRLIMDPQKESELAKQVVEGSLKADDFERQIEELNENSCK